MYCLFVLFHLATVLSVLLWFTAFDYLFGIFKLVLRLNLNILCCIRKEITVLLNVLTTNISRGLSIDLCYKNTPKNSWCPFSISCALQGRSLVLFLYLQELFIYHVQSHQRSSWRCRTENVFGSLISTRIKKSLKKMLFNFKF